MRLPSMTPGVVKRHNIHEKGTGKPEEVEGVVGTRKRRLPDCPYHIQEKRDKTQRR
jgi:hypothetical protein